MLTEPQIYGFLEDYDDWIYEAGEMSATYEFESFLEAIAFVNDLAEIVENMGYGPSILIDDYKVSLRLGIKGEQTIEEKDLELIKGIVDLLDGE